MSHYLDKTNSLTPLASEVICLKSTERPFSSEDVSPLIRGSYLCRRCGLALFRATQRFSSGCGWPSFDDSIEGALIEKMDADGRREEIVCGRCEGHLGHVFRGEQMTARNTRHCVNAVSIDFVADTQVKDTEEIIVAGGCFWGVEYYFNKMDGVVKAESGYIGGHIEYPSYEQVCSGQSGHYEAVRVVYDPDKTTLEQVLKLFFEIHNPEQTSGQGPDIGPQYRSAVFYYHQQQRQVAERLIQQLILHGYQPSTELLPVSTFWPAEQYHQQYYLKNRSTPYCHRREQKF